ncbi:hypothetical protein B296_00048970 [Ensete ventricosum]|uniref:Uncharacterized protein n=1 Tax=Ensete ventricosum TaxID=4639 RepID=A0A426YSM7_ENSVE|nr:hypothetical protein B296_00048970 [Ensete ventricosum]
MAAKRSDNSEVAKSSNGGEDSGNEGVIPIEMRRLGLGLNKVYIVALVGSSALEIERALRPRPGDQESALEIERALRPRLASSRPSA